MVDRDRQHDRHRAVGDVRGVPRAAHADLDHRHVDRRLREPRRRPSRRPSRRTTAGASARRRRCAMYGATSLNAATNSSSLSGSPSTRDPLAHPLDVRAGEPAGAQVERAQQGVDHPRGRGLAVGPGQVDHRVAALRVAEQVEEGRDPVQRRLELGLRPARQQRVLGLGVGLGEAGRGSESSSGRSVIGRELGCVAGDLRDPDDLGVARPDRRVSPGSRGTQPR